MATDWGATIGDRDLVAMAVSEGCMIRQGDACPVPQYPHNRTLHGLTGLLIDDAEHLVNMASEGFLSRPPRQAGRDWIHEGNRARGIRGNHRVSNARQRHLEPIPLTPQVLLSAFAFNGIANGTPQQVAIHLIFDQIILRSFFDCPNGKRLVVQTREHDDGHGRRLGVQRRKGVEPLAIRQGEIEQHRIKALRSELLQRLHEAPDMRYHALSGTTPSWTLLTSPGASVRLWDCLQPAVLVRVETLYQAAERSRMPLGRRCAWHRYRAWRLSQTSVSQGNT